MVSGRKQIALEGRCANHFELAFTEFEFLLDFGQAYGDSSEAFMHTRIIATPRSVKILLNMLQDMIEKYEKTIAPVPERKA